MKLNNVLSIALLASSGAALLSTNIVDSWDVQDLKAYLKDNSISYDEKRATLNELRDLGLKQWHYKQHQSWYSPSILKQKLLGWGSAASHAAEETAVDYENLKDWVFSTWSVSELEKLLTKAGIKHESRATRSELERLAQENYDAIAKSFKATGKYPGDWLYSTWDKKDLKSWLNEYGVDYSSLRDSKEDLVRKVREHSYKASQYAADERDNVLESLDLTSQSLYNKAGELKDDVFSGWSSSQIYDWLKTHKIDFEESLNNNRKELAGIAAKHTNDLKSDIEYWLKKAQKTASPYLEKGSKKADDVINDTFGVDGWSKPRLRAFLDSRDVSIPTFATKRTLVKLVKENKYKPITKFNSEAFFAGWSKENVQKWLEEQGASAQKGTKEWAGKANDAYKSFAVSLSDYAKAAQEKVQDATGYPPKKTGKDAFFDKWSDVELREYLSTFGYKKSASAKRSELLDAAKKNTLWFVGGDSSTGRAATGVVANVKLHASNAANAAVYHWRNLVNWIYYKNFW